MKKLFIRAVTLVTALIMLLGLPLQSMAEGEMAYNLYTSLDTSKTSGVYTTFMIDFRAPVTYKSTYWALANFGLDITKETLKKYKNLSAGGGYAGMQVRGADDDRVGILSFWRWEYQTASGIDYLYADTVYPVGYQSRFDNEGSGSNSLQPYTWADNQWYTMALHTWEDAETGTTFAGLWILDQTTGKWTLITYYNTYLLNSGWKGDMGLFMENYGSGNREGERQFNVKNMYVLDKKDALWKSLNTATISYGDGGKANKVGTHEFGATDEYLWGMTNGTMIDNQDEYEKNATKRQTYTITQPDKPTYGTPEVKTIRLNARSGKRTVAWEMADTSTPQLGYKIEILDTEGNVLVTKSATRPHEVYVEIPKEELDVKAEVKCVLTVTDIFGQSTTFEGYTRNYPKDDAESSSPAEPSPSLSESAPAPSEPAPNNDGPSLDTGVIIGIVAGVAVAVAAVAVVAIVVSKKKKQA